MPLFLSGSKDKPESISSLQRGLDVLWLKQNERVTPYVVINSRGKLSSFPLRLIVVFCLQVFLIQFHSYFQTHFFIMRFQRVFFFKCKLHRKSAICFSHRIKTFYKFFQFINGCTEDDLVILGCCSSSVTAAGDNYLKIIFQHGGDHRIYAGCMRRDP